MTPDEAREIAIRELRALGRDTNVQALRAEVYEAAAVLEALGGTT